MFNESTHYTSVYLIVPEKDKGHKVKRPSALSIRENPFSLSHVSERLPVAHA
jgi:hypothetical protein